jgi:L-threonylcarbamoyladenylate synthase
MAGSNDHIGEGAQRYGNATITQAAARLHGGDLVAVPTETVYGLAADSTNAKAVAEIYRAKDRPDFNPLIVHVPSLEAAQKLGQFNALARNLAERFWPGPLTLIVPKTEDCPVTHAVTAGLETIALRCSAHPAMQQLLQESGLYLAAPSANKSGEISPTIADHVRKSLGADTLMILDGGPCKNGVESTLVGISGNDYRLLRPGPVTREQLEELIGRPPLEKPLIEQPDDEISAPGQLASHYAPQKPLRLNAETAKPSEYYIGFGDIGGDGNLSATSDLAEAASKLFAMLHQADASDRASIAVAPIPSAGIGAAINDRFRRAASTS